MKRISYLAAIVLTALMTSCTGFGLKGQGGESGDSVEAVTLTFDTLHVVRSRKLIEGKEQPCYDINLQLLLAREENEVARLTNQTICRMFFEKEGDAAKLMNQMADSVANGFAQELMEFYDPENEDASFTSAYTYEEKGYPLPNARSGYLVYERNLYSYLGGAHGSTFFQYRNIRLTDGKVMLQSDVFLPGEAEEKVKALIMRQLMEDSDCATVEQLQEETGITMLGDVYINDDNFQLLADGILFLYNIYEIAPYACGPVSVVVPYDQLAPYIQPL